MTDILFGNNNRPVLKLLAKRSLKAQKNTIAVLAIMLATLLFTSLFTIAISLQTAMQESNMRTTGTSAHLSKVTLRQTFNGMINMYRLVGGALCAILALIGILNFINSMTTSILSRYREIAMLQSVGMTGRQVKQILIYEGIGYSILGLLGSLILSVIASLTVVRMMGAELTYFTWHFTLIPVFLCIIPLILITAIVPLVCYNKMAQKTVVERLRIAE